MNIFELKMRKMAGKTSYYLKKKSFHNISLLKITRITHT